PPGIDADVAVLVALAAGAARLLHDVEGHGAVPGDARPHLEDGAGDEVLHLAAGAVAAEARVHGHRGDRDPAADVERGLVVVAHHHRRRLQHLDVTDLVQRADDRGRVAAQEGPGQAGVHAAGRAAADVARDRAPGVAA